MATKSIVATKVGMTQIWDEDNRIVPVTVLRVQPCRVVQIKTPERDGYSALQVTFGQRDARKLTMPKAGHFAAAGVAPGDQLVELRLDDVSGYEVGQELAADVFAAGELVDVTGVSKGKGFAGVMKRHNFRGGPRTHGQSDRARHPGSIGPGSTPGRVFKGLKMAGHMGHARVTVQNLRIVSVDPDNNLILIKGAVPGPTEGTLIVRKAVKNHK